MADSSSLDRFDHPAWIAAAGTAGGYLLLLGVLTVLLFALPYLAFVWF